MWKCGFGLAQPSAAGPSSPLLVLCCLLPKSDKRYKHQENFKTKRETQGKWITAAPPQEFHAWYATGCGTLYPGQSLWLSWSARQNLKVWLYSNESSWWVHSNMVVKNPLRSCSDQMKALNKYCMLYIMLRCHNVKVSGSVLLKVDKIPGVVKELSTA